MTGADPTSGLTGELAPSCPAFYAGAAVFQRRGSAVGRFIDDPLVAAAPGQAGDRAAPERRRGWPSCCRLPRSSKRRRPAGPARRHRLAERRWLGLVGWPSPTCLLPLLNAWGAYRASLITYAMPVVGILLGVLVLNRSSTWTLSARPWLGGMRWPTPLRSSPHRRARTRATCCLSRCPIRYGRRPRPIRYRRLG